MPLTDLQFNHNPVSDLTPVEGMPLETLGCAETKVSDFSPLKDVKTLKVLGAQLLPVTDLSPLAGLSLTGIDLYHTVGVTSLEPLKGMPLEGLNLQDVPVSDLSPLKGMTTLRTLVLHATKVSDLSPLAGLKLTDLFLNNKEITDLAPLNGMPLSRLAIDGTGVTDLRPLQGMELAEIRFIPKNITHGLDVLRGMKSLTTIGIEGGKAWPAAEFWERYDKGTVNACAWLSYQAHTTYSKLAFWPADQRVAPGRNSRGWRKIRQSSPILLFTLPTTLATFRLT
jgi:Leucine-rich repeat (LRR) protein